MPSIKRNIAWNFLGLASPLLMAAYAVPLLIHRLGPERFGVLTLAWTIIGYFSIFDLGLGRALTKIVSEQIAGVAVSQTNATLWTSLTLMAAFGCIASLILTIFASPIVSLLLGHAGPLQIEARAAVPMIALAVPFVTTTSGLRGAIEARQTFFALSIIRIFSGILTFLAPILALNIAPNLQTVIGSLLIVRVITWIAHLRLLLYSWPTFKSNPHIEWNMALRLLKYGGWVTLGNIAAPVLLYIDRFFVAANLTASSVAYYATPQELVARLSMVPIAIVSVLFPAFSASRVSDFKRMRSLYVKGLFAVILTVLPIALGFTLFGRTGLRLWLGLEFAQRSYPVLILFAAGLFLNALAMIPFALVQAAGRPEITALLYVLEVVPYSLIEILAIRNWGIEGAALVSTCRVAVDAAVLFWFAHRHVLNITPSREPSTETPVYAS